MSSNIAHLAEAALFTRKSNKWCAASGRRSRRPGPLRRRRGTLRCARRRAGSATSMPPLDRRDGLLRAVAVGVVGEDHGGPRSRRHGSAAPCAIPRAAAGDDCDLHGCLPVRSWSAVPPRYLDPPIAGQGTATDARTFGAAPCMILFCVSRVVLESSCAPRRAARADRPPRPARPEDRHRRRPDFGRRAGDAAGRDVGTVIALIAQGAKRLASGERVYDYRAGQYLVASVDLPSPVTHRRAAPGGRHWASA